jgi:hypothetical protein
MKVLKRKGKQSPKFEQQDAQPESPAPQYTPREADLESLRPVATEPPLPPVEKRDRYGLGKIAVFGVHATVC